MASRLAEAHITAQARLRALTARGVDAIWASLPAYNDENVDEWLTRVLPLIAAAQRQSVSLTDAFLAQAVARAPLGVNPERVTGPAVRAGVPPEEVYRRPFVAVWSALKAGTAYDKAVAAGGARATGTAAMDVQLSMRATLREVGEADDLILGYQRVPDAGACQFCQLIADQRYRTDDLMPVHNHCGCGVDVISGPERPSFSGVYANDIPEVAVHNHGELGPVLGDPSHSFTAESDM